MGERREELGADEIGGVSSELGAVARPRLARGERRRRDHEPEELGRLAGHLVDDVQDGQHDQDSKRQRGQPERRAARSSAARPSRPARDPPRRRGACAAGGAAASAPRPAAAPRGGVTAASG